MSNREQPHHFDQLAAQLASIDSELPPPDIAEQRLILGGIMHRFETERAQADLNKQIIDQLANPSLLNIPGVVIRPLSMITVTDDSSHEQQTIALGLVLESQIGTSYRWAPLSGFNCVKRQRTAGTHEAWGDPTECSYINNEQAQLLCNHIDELERLKYENILPNLNLGTYHIE